MEPRTFRIVKRRPLPPALKAVLVTVGSEPAPHLTHLGPVPNGSTDRLERLHQRRRRHRVGVERRFPVDHRRLPVDLVEVDHRRENLTSGRQQVVVVDENLRDVGRSDF